MKKRLLAGVASLGLLGALVTVASCSDDSLDGTLSATTGTGGKGSSTSNASTSNGFSDVSASSGTPCVGLQCQIHQCTGGGHTTIKGTIYDPAGKNPLYGVVAYVPNSTPQPFTQGASCDSCADLYTGDPIAAAVTDAQGNFTILDAPDGKDIPLVIQVGKWRRQFVIPEVTQCGDTTVQQKLTLPKNGTEGDIPQIAVSTGGADTLECLLSRIGIDKSEYGPGAGGAGHIHIFHGAGGPDTSPGAPDSNDALWDKAEDIMKYDIVVLSCEGDETSNMNQQVLFDYAAAGGRVFASHFHYAWFNTGPFGDKNLASWVTGSNDIGNIQANVVTTDWAGMPFARGQALQDWLKNVSALDNNNKLPIQAARHNADVAATNTISQPWIVAEDGPTQDFSFDTPLGVEPEKQCGRVVYSDMHVGAAANDYDNQNTTPGGCAEQDLSPQEKALEFILFDLSSCVTPNNIPMQPPGEPPQ
ncbi:MAG: carboxypeptidase regulatory-like domain-containing protein [Polyangiaceae bacterium]